MLFNHASAIILNLLFFQIDHLLRDTTGADSVAFSPVMDCTVPSMHVHAAILLKESSRETAIHMAMDNFTPEEFGKVTGLFAGMIHDSPIALNMICKKKNSYWFLNKISARQSIQIN